MGDCLWSCIVIKVALHFLIKLNSFLIQSQKWNYNQKYQIGTFFCHEKMGFCLWVCTTANTLQVSWKLIQIWIHFYSWVYSPANPIDCLSVCISACISLSLVGVVWVLVWVWGNILIGFVQISRNIQFRIKIQHKSIS